jgi:hypothetical protein
MGTKAIRTSKHAQELDFIGGHLEVDEGIDFVVPVNEYRILAPGMGDGQEADLGPEVFRDCGDLL